MEFLNFAEISKEVAFHKLLNWLNIPFKETDKELKGDYFIVNKEKNLYINTKVKDQKGSCINFLSHHKQIDLRSAASEIKKQFLTKKEEPKKELPDLKLEYTDQLMTFGIDDELAQQYEIGLVKQRSIMAGKIALKVYRPDNTLEGYIGYSVKEGWVFPKNFKRPLWNLNRLYPEAQLLYMVAHPFDALKILSTRFHSVVCLLGNSMTDEQFEQLSRLKKLQRIYVIHKDPHNIYQRLATKYFTKYAIPETPLREMSTEQFMNRYYFNNPLNGGDHVFTH